ncbi:hypothetical protein BpHYR1_004885 [Brachionus plicatilis]|uniref:Uncharacterized protein n=1 Tax=Brachionus plicatilis TaxID=10195 RepID=A0A3M7RQH8_BRAPC|nr:hypothetical protein BpHYR1_004885 [Brachionus plicatilis]
MYEEDVENMTPYELALSSKSDECKNFVLECLKPVQQLEEKENMPCWFKLSRTKRFKFKIACKSFIGNLFGLENYWKKSFFHTYRDDDTIWTKSHSVPDAFHKSFSSEQNDSQDDTLNNLDDESECSLSSNDLRNSISNNTSSQTSATNRKINLRRIGSMLRLKRAKDINHEPAYLYRQKFRPAPVSLPEQSKITGFKNEPTSQPENEDDLNDSVIDEFINHVQNNSIKQSEKTSTTTVAQCLNNTRASRYDQHKELKQNEKKEDGQSQKTNSPPKKSETSNLGIILKNSLSSSRETTPTIIRLSRSGTPTPLLQSVTQTRVVPENENADHSSKINLLNQRRVSSKEKSKSPNPLVNKQPLVKSNSDNSNFVKRRNASTARRYSLTREEKKFEDTKIRRQSLNNYSKVSSTDFSHANAVTQIYEPEPDYWDVPYSNNINHISRTNIKIEQAEQREAAVSLAQVILKSVKESIKQNDNKHYNENIIVSETVHIISDHKEIKSVESANENKCESVYNVIEDGEKLTEFKTSLKIEPLSDQSASFVSVFDDLPQPPSQSFLKMTQMELECTELELNGCPGDPSHLPPPPPPLPTSAIPATPPALALNINAETLLMAKNNLKLKSTKAESKAKENSKLLENKDLKKNFFLLQEIQNHRLYNTKKDYVLEYLDRNTNLVPSVSYSPCSSGSTLGKMQSGNRSLSNSELNKAEDEDKVNCMPASQSPAHHSISPLQCTPVSNYERFPHLKNKNALNQNKFYACGSYLANKRAQSSIPVNRNSLALSQPANGRSFSVERTSIVEPDQRSVHESNNNNNSCVIIIDKNEKIDTKNEPEQTKESNNLVHFKKFRQIIPQEKIESELDRVFRNR